MWHDIREVLEHALVTCPCRGVTQGGLGTMGPLGGVSPARNFAGIVGEVSIDHRLLNRHAQQIAVRRNRKADC